MGLSELRGLMGAGKDPVQLAATISIGADRSTRSRLPATTPVTRKTYPPAVRVRVGTWNSASAEARETGHGGVSVVAHSTGLARSTIMPACAT